MVIRWAASLLLLLTALLPLQPLLAGAQVKATRPACCRRHGKHHCMMQHAMMVALGVAASNGPAWTPPPCPWRPNVLPAVVATAAPGFHLASRAIPVATVVTSAATTFLGYRALSQSTRAPPAVLL